jgi:hypothetical protein
MNIKHTLLIALAALTLGCKKNNYTDPTLPGNMYNGQLVADEKPDAFKTGPITIPVSVNFSGSNYNSALLAPANFAAAAKGSFKLTAGSIQLTDSLAHPANFDWNLILTGKYAYTLKGDSLIMTRIAGTNTYSYNLKKVN